MLIRRWYCREAHATASFIPDFAAARLPAELHEIEDVVATFDKERQQGATVEQAAGMVRPDIESAGALRWVRRRLLWVQTTLALLVGVIPAVLAERQLTTENVRSVLRTDCVLVRAREIAALHLAHAAAPVGFGPLPHHGKKPAGAAQHAVGVERPP